MNETNETITSDQSGPERMSLDMVKDVEVEVTVEIGRRRMRIADILALRAGDVLELSKVAGDPLDIYVNGRLLGRGEVVVVGERYAVRMVTFHGALPGGPSHAFP